MNRFRFIVGTALLRAAAFRRYGHRRRLPPTVAVVSGNGQLICQFLLWPDSRFSFQPMVVKVTDASGNPVNGASVNWSVTVRRLRAAISRALRPARPIANGLAFNELFDLQFHARRHAGQRLLRRLRSSATAGNSAATFTLTQGLQANAAITGGHQLPPITVRVSPGQPESFSRRGSDRAGREHLRRRRSRSRWLPRQLNTPVPNVAVMIVNDPTSRRHDSVRVAGRRRHEHGAHGRKRYCDLQPRFRRHAERDGQRAGLGWRRVSARALHRRSDAAAEFRS